MKTKVLLFLLCVFVSINATFSQGEASNWYFGNSAGITFNTDPPTCLLGGQTQIQEGCATVSDRFGNLMFYTDGQKVWNKNHKIMPNGTGLTGDPSSTQSGMFVPNPQNTSEYFVFTVSAVGNRDLLFAYSTIDITADGGLGAIKPLEKNITLFDECTEQVTAVASGDRKGYWVLGSQRLSKNIYSYYVGPNGVNTTPVISLAPFDNYQVGQLKVSPDGKRAVKISKNANVEGHELCLEIYDFDDMTGKLTNPRIVPGPGLLLGFEFSPDGTKLYVPQKINSVGKIVVYDLTASTGSAVLNSLTTVGDSKAAVFQLGPDGKIYIPNGKFLDVIENPNDPSSQLQISYNKIDLCGGSTFASLPQFIQSNLLPTVEVKNKCLGDLTSFEFLQSATNITWNFNDPTSASNTATGINATHKFTAAGKYDVAVTFDAYGASESVVIPVEINEFIAPEASNDIEKCFGEKVALSYRPISGLSYQWSTGEVGSKIEVFNAGTYWVESNNKGCKVKEEIVVSDGDCSKPIIDTIEYCNTATVPLSVEQATAYKWSTGATTQSIVHDVSAGNIVTVDISKLAVNAMANGSFEASLASYTSDYSSDQNINPGSYFITSSLQNSPISKGHGGTGRFFVVSTSNTKASILKQTNIPVVAGQEYVFSFWMSTPDQNNNGTDFHVEINGIDISGKISSPPSSSGWVLAEYTWTANTATAEIEFVNNTADDGRLGLDEINMSFVIEKNYEYRLVELCLDCKDVTFDAYTFCANGQKHLLSVTPSSTSSCSNIQWYATETSAAVLQTGCTFTTPILNVETSYWLYDKSSESGCKRIEYKVARAEVCYEICGNGLDDDNDGLIDEACEPFVCDGTLYIINSDKLFLQTMSLAPVGFTPISPIRSTSTPIGYNPADNFIYALDGHGLQRIDANGTSEILANEIYLPDNKLIGSISAGFGSDGLFYFMQSKNVYSLDVTTLKTNLVMSNITSVWDIAQNPKDGFFYGVAGSNLYKFDMAAGTEVNLGNFGVPVSQAGSAFFDPSGALIIGAYGGAFVKIDVNTVKGTVIDPGNPTVNGYDGASCAAYVLMNKTASKKTLAVGDMFTYSIDIYNETGGTLSNLAFEDIIDARFEVTSIVSNNLGAITAGTGVGESSIRIENINLPLGKTSLVFEVQVKNASYCADEIIPNQASLTNLPIRFGVTTLSDDPTTAKLKDETIVTVTGASGTLDAGTISTTTIESCSPLKDTVRLSGYTGSIKWEHSIDNLTWSDLTTANSDAYFLPLLKTNNGNSSTTEYYRARVFCGSTAKYSDVVTVITHTNVKVDLGNDTTLCAGDTLILDAKAGFDTYLWSDGSANQTLIVTETGDYSVTVTKAVCSDIDTVSVTVNSRPDVDLGKDTVSCGNITLDAGTFSSYAWSNGATAQTIDIAISGVYSVTVTENGCSNSDTINVEINGAFVINAGNDTTFCAGDTLILDAKAGFDIYLWSDGSANQTLIVTETGDYSVTVTKGVCSDIDTVSVTVNSRPDVDLGKDTVSCGNITLDAGTFSSYAWSNGATAQTIDIATSDVYSVTVTENGCSNSDTVNVEVSGTFTINPGNDTTLCAGDTLILDAKAGFDIYLWSDGSANQTLIVTETGDYSVTVTKAVCSDIDTVSVTVNSRPVVDLGKDTVSCGNITLDAGTFSSYAWSNGATAQTIDITVSDAYSVTVTENGCSNSDTVNVELSGTFTINPGNDTTLCAGQTLLLDAKTGYDSYQWSDGTTLNSISVSAAGDYSVTVTKGACTAIDTVKVLMNDQPSVALGNDIALCPTESILLDATYPSATYIWNEGSTFPTQLIQLSGIYSVTVSIGHCTAADSITVSFIDKKTISLGPDQTLCEGDTTLLDATVAGATYLWNPASTDPVFKVTQAGQYAVTVTISGCEASDTVSIAFNPVPKIDLGDDQILCLGQTATLNANYLGANYLWQDGDVSSTRNVSESGDYLVDVILANCTFRDSVNVSFYTKPVITVADVALCAGDEATLSATTSSGTITWDGGVAGQADYTTSPTNDTTCTFTITYGNACSVDSFAQVKVNPLPIFSLGDDRLLCANEATMLMAPVGVPVKWQDGGAMAVRTITAPGGTYIATVTDKGCHWSDTVKVEFTSLPNFSILGAPVIYRGDTAFYEVSTPFAAYLWNTSSLKRAISINPQNRNTYWVQVEDSYECRDTAYITVEVLPRPEIGIPDTALCVGSTMKLSVKDEFDHYDWSTGQTSRSIDISTGGDYIIRASRTDEPTIALIDTIKVRTVQNPNFEIEGIKDICQGELTNIGTDQLVIAQYLWSTGEKSSRINVATSGTYTLTVTAFGCSSTRTMNVAVHELPAAPLVEALTKVCYDSKLPVLEATGNNIEWYADAQAMNKVETGNSLDLTNVFTGDIAQDAEETVYLRATAQYCNSALVPARIKRLLPAGQLSIQADKLQFCEGDKGVPFAATSGFAGYSWSISDARLWNSAGETVAAEFPATGTPQLQVDALDMDGCAYSAIQKLTVVALPHIDFTATSNNGVAYLSNTSISDRNNPSRYWWAIDTSGFELAAKRDTVFTVAYGEHKFILRAQNTAGCAQVLTKELFADMPFCLYIPTAFSPTHHSPELAQFRIKGSNLESFTIWIYDNWGNTIWFTNKLDENGSPAEAWSGIYQGELAPADIYFWKIEARFTNGDKWKGVLAKNGKYKKMGRILLIR
jgi:hypothetical protein